MKMHRYEELWLIISGGMLVIFMLITGYQTFALGMGPPSHKETLDPQRLTKPHHLITQVFTIGATMSMKSL